MGDRQLMIRSLLFLLLVSIVGLLAIAPCSHGLNPKPDDQLPSLVTTSTQLKYHNGPLLTGPTINIYLIWYGPFSLTNRTIISNFFASLDPSTAHSLRRQPTVSTWWATAKSYKDATGKPVSGSVKLAREVGDVNYSRGKNIKRADIAILVKNAIAQKAFPVDPTGIYFVLTAADVTVEKFCMGSCGFHDSFMVSPTERVVYAHVGDPHAQCPSLCAWPYAVPSYGPPGPALVAPNSVGMDAMVVNIATVLAGAATNPLKTGYFQGDALAPLEAVTACPGIFGADAYPGYPGKLMVDQASKGSFNVYGAEGRMFLVPGMWDPLSLTCKVVVA
ncbi:PREDICTED: protein EXORDIUM-like 2 [Nelumbo nucifera]|nr:PREDICTED: protein EXORDIUM-like 2 [Nelumbo nucifera]